jgi:protein ImuB
VNSRQRPAVSSDLAKRPGFVCELEGGGGRLATVFACLRGPADGEAALWAIARDFSPRVMRVAAGEVVVDVSGLGRLIGAPDAIARELRRAVVDATVDATVAVAPTQTAARVLARVPCLTSIAEASVTVLRDLETLPPGTHVRDRERPYETLERWGIATLAQLAALPAADLASRLGRRGAALQQLAQGRDPHPFVPDAAVPRFIERLELEWPIDALEPLSFVFARLLESLSAALERADRGAAAIHLDLRLTDRSIDTRVLQLPAPMRDPRVLRTLLQLELESRPPSPPSGSGETGLPGAPDGTRDVSIDIVTIEIDPAPSRITQFSLLDRAVPSPEAVSTLVARLSALMGESRIGSPRVVDSHQPGAFAMDPFAVAPVAPQNRPAPIHGEAPRTGAASVVRRQRIPAAIRVNVSGGRPVYLAPSRRGVPSGAVIHSAGPWRASGGWWMTSVPPKPRSGDGGWDRSEWDVALAHGEACRIFQDRATGCWFFEGLYD